MYLKLNIKNINKCLKLSVWCLLLNVKNQKSDINSQALINFYRKREGDKNKQDYEKDKNVRTEKMKFKWNS